MKYEHDQRIVMTLDAGGTNFVYSAIRANEDVVEPITKPSNAHHLRSCLDSMVDGFAEIRSKLPYGPAAISFAFPGPADYPLGIIGDLQNLPAFRGGVALGPMLHEKFGLPVFINNDGDLFAYGEALAGFLPYINALLEESGSPKRFNNLVGITLGTGFGGGIVRNAELFLGDNSVAGEVWLLRNRQDPEKNAEEGASIRAVQRVYAEKAGIAFEEAPSPKEILDIAQGRSKGHAEAARESFRCLGKVVGDALANVLTLIDGLVVIGGGVAGAHEVFLDEVVREMNTPFRFPVGQERPRLVSHVYNLQDGHERELFVRGEKKSIMVPESQSRITYDPLRRVGVGLSRLGTSKAVHIGAYSFALHTLDRT
jgi:glucokinase